MGTIINNASLSIIHDLNVNVLKDMPTVVRYRVPIQLP